MKTDAQPLPPVAVKEEEIDPLGEQEELGIFQMLDKLEEVTEALLTRWIIVFKIFACIFKIFFYVPFTIKQTESQLRYKM